MRGNAAGGEEGFGRLWLTLVWCVVLVDWIVVDFGVVCVLAYWVGLVG